MDWLSKIDPNVVLGAITTLIGIGTWVYHKVRGDQAESVTDLLSSAADSLAHDLLADNKTLPDAQAWLETKLWSILASHNIQPNDLTRMAVAGAVQYGMAQLKKLLNDRASNALPSQIADLSAKADAVLKAWKDAEKGLPGVTQGPIVGTGG